jgi:hypothetical protein
LQNSPLSQRRHGKPPHLEGDPSATSSVVLGKRRSMPPFLSLFPGGYTGERLVMRRRSDPITPPFGLHQLAGGGDTADEEDAPPPASLFQRRRGSEPVDVLNAAQRVFLQGCGGFLHLSQIASIFQFSKLLFRLHHSISASSMTNDHRSTGCFDEESQRKRRSHHSSPGQSLNLQLAQMISPI